jgi:hypothetical protein
MGEHSLHIRRRAYTVHFLINNQCLLNLKLAETFEWKILGFGREVGATVLAVQYIGADSYHCTAVGIRLLATKISFQIYVFHIWSNVKFHYLFFLQKDLYKLLKLFFHLGHAMKYTKY